MSWCFVSTQRKPHLQIGSSLSFGSLGTPKVSRPKLATQNRCFLQRTFFPGDYWTSSAIHSTSSVIHLGVSNKHSEQLTCEPSNNIYPFTYPETRRFNPSHSTLAGPSSNPSTRKDEILAGAAAHAVNRCCISLDLGEILVKKICKIMFTKQVCILTSDQSPWCKQCKTHTHINCRWWIQ